MITCAKKSSVEYFIRYNGIPDETVNEIKTVLPELRGWGMVHDQLVICDPRTPLIEIVLSVGDYVSVAKNGFLGGPYTSIPDEFFIISKIDNESLNRCAKYLRIAHKNLLHGNDAVIGEIRAALFNLTAVCVELAENGVGD